MLAQVASAAIANPPPALRRGLDRQAGGHLTAIGSLHGKQPGETVFMEGDEADSIYEVVRGTLRLYKLLPDGRRQITGFLSRGHLLGLAPEGVCVYSAEAITEVTLCRTSRAVFERLIDKVPGFARRLLTAASHELCAAQASAFGYSARRYRAIQANPAIADVWLGLAAGLVGVLVGGVFDHFYFKPDQFHATMTLVWILMGLALAAAHLAAADTAESAA